MTILSRRNWVLFVLFTFLWKIVLSYSFRCKQIKWFYKFKIRTVSQILFMCPIEIHAKKGRELETEASRSLPSWLMISHSEERRLLLVSQFLWGSWQFNFVHFTSGVTLSVVDQHNITCVLGLQLFRDLGVSPLHTEKLTLHWVSYMMLF